MSPPLRTSLGDLLLLPILLIPYVPGVAEVVAARLGLKASTPILSTPTPEVMRLKVHPTSAAPPTRGG